MSEHRDNPPVEEISGRRRETGRDKYYSLEELPKKLESDVLSLEKKVEKYKRVIETKRKNLEDEGLDEHQKAKIEESIKDYQQQIEESEKLIKEYLSKETNMCHTLFPGYEWKDKEKLIQHAVYKNKEGQPQSEITIQPDPDDLEFGLLMSISMFPGAGMYGEADRAFNTVGPDFGGKCVGVTVRPFIIRMYNRTSNRKALDYGFDSGRPVGTNFPSPYFFTAPLVQEYLPKRGTNVDGEKDDLGHFKGSEIGEVIRIASARDEYAAENRQFLSNTLAKLGYNPADYGLPPAKKEEPKPRPEPKRQPKAVEPIVSQPEDESLRKSHEDMTEPVKITPATESAQEKPAEKLPVFITPYEMDELRRKMILGEVEPDFKGRELRKEYLKLQKAVADATERLESERQIKVGIFARIFGSGKEGVQRREGDLVSARIELDNFRKINKISTPAHEEHQNNEGNLPTKDLSYNDMMAGGRTEKPKKNRDKKGPSDYDSMMGRD